MSNKDRPCNGCNKRYVGCHSRCKEYADSVSANAEKRDRIQRAEAEDRLMAGYMIAARLRCSAK